MSFKQAGASGWENKFVCSGRSTRSAFWFWYLFYAIVIIGFTLIEVAVFSGAAALRNSNGTLGTIAMVIGIILAIAMGITSVILIIATEAASVRRLHDRGESGWFLLLYLVPFGSIVILVFMVLPDTPGDNEYGAVTASALP